ncbi:Zinc finger FYVE domain-containing protein 1 [Intoshia linei]|uniref:Zinc finger FYVE domain-containing protein 1 n=1 Tax=Intoshia linei TaxID=1819745 RepID=A0A177BE50_9BILA|nr:Zinc finger FYVE domain-containing protein 1 [Intoshia linei]
MKKRNKIKNKKQIKKNKTHIISDIESQHSEENAVQNQALTTPIAYDSNCDFFQKNWKTSKNDSNESHRETNFQESIDKSNSFIVQSSSSNSSCDLKIFDSMCENLQVKNVNILNVSKSNNFEKSINDSSSKHVLKMEKFIDSNHDGSDKLDAMSDTDSFDFPLDSDIVIKLSASTLNLNQDDINPENLQNLTERMESWELNDESDNNALKKDVFCQKSVQTEDSSEFIPPSVDTPELVSFDEIAVEESTNIDTFSQICSKEDVLSNITECNDENINFSRMKLEELLPQTTSYKPSKNNHWYNDAPIEESQPSDEIVDSVLLIDSDEILQFTDSKTFIQKIVPNATNLQMSARVIAIFGTQGCGKSHTLNSTFFSNHNVFQVYKSQPEKTRGIWVSYSMADNALIIDTEGINLSLSSGEEMANKTNFRLLVKIFSICDAVLYLTRSDRLNSDAFHFIMEALNATRHYIKESPLQKESILLNNEIYQKFPEKNVSESAPGIVIYHETIHTRPLTQIEENEFLKQCFSETGYDIKDIGLYRYVGVNYGYKSSHNSLSNAINGIMRWVKERSIHEIFYYLKSINSRFNHKNYENSLSMQNVPISEKLFKCDFACSSCNGTCCRGTNHLGSHRSLTKCKYNISFDNKILYCKHCYNNNKYITVVPKAMSKQDNTWVGLVKYAWTGYVLECTFCGIIYHSRKYWFGNPDPIHDSDTVYWEVIHVWPKVPQIITQEHHAARYLVDGVSQIKHNVKDYGTQPTSKITRWISDQIAPSYWVPNYKILGCFNCKTDLSCESRKIHHCRACGNGFCNTCTRFKRQVPERGWGVTSVRVCKVCYQTNVQQKGGTFDTLDDEEVSLSGESRRSELLFQKKIDIKIKKLDVEDYGDGTQFTARKFCETISNTMEKVSNVTEASINYICDSARPSYWQADIDIFDCFVCKVKFDEEISIHHCRNCGNGVCNACSKCRLPVVLKGWDRPVRICDKCVQNKLC